MCDQFYTNADVARSCIDTVMRRYDLLHDFDMCLEPSAGKGSFFKLLPLQSRYGIDVDPKFDGVIKGDFLEYVHDPRYTRCIVIGNPPFGRLCSMAIRFFNHAASFANVIAFIVPRTFKRVSVHNRLDMHFHLVYCQDLPVKPCCFTPKLSAKCCFQIWERRHEARLRLKMPSTHPDFIFLPWGPKDDKGNPTPPVEADFAIKAYGSCCGTIQKEGLHALTPKSWHWIKSNIPVDDLIQRLSRIDYSMSMDTVRQDSIGQSELVYLYAKVGV